MSIKYFCTIFMVSFLLVSCSSPYTQVALTPRNKLIIFGKIHEKDLHPYYFSKTVRSVYVTKENYKLVLTRLDRWPNLTEIKIDTFNEDICPYLKNVNNQLSSLILNNSSMNTLPACIETMPNLRSLALHNMPNLQWSKAFTVLSSLPSLTKLDLATNSLYNVPDEIKKLKRVNNLNLDNTYITEIPRGLYEMTKLDTLSINNNKISTIKEFMFSSVAQNLICLFLSKNEITTFEIDKEKRYLFQNLSLSRNRIGKLDFDFLNNMPNIESVSFSENDFRQVDNIDNVPKHPIIFIELPCELDQDQFIILRKKFPHAYVYCSKADETM